MVDTLMLGDGREEKVLFVPEPELVTTGGAERRAEEVTGDVGEKIFRDGGFSGLR